MLAGCGRSGVWLPYKEPDPVSRCAGVDGTFATRVLAYDPTFGGGFAPEQASYRDPAAALGVPDYVHERAEGAVALGEGGFELRREYERRFTLDRYLEGMASAIRGIAERS